MGSPASPVDQHKYFDGLVAKMRTAQKKLAQSKSTRNQKEADQAEKLVDQELARLAPTNPTIADESSKQRLI